MHDWFHSNVWSRRNLSSGPNNDSSKEPYLDYVMVDESPTSETMKFCYGGAYYYIIRKLVTCSVLDLCTNGSKQFCQDIRVGCHSAPSWQKVYQENTCITLKLSWDHFSCNDHWTSNSERLRWFWIFVRTIAGVEAVTDWPERGISSRFTQKSSKTLQHLVIYVAIHAIITIHFRHFPVNFCQFSVLFTRTNYTWLLFDCGLL